MISRLALMAWRGFGIAGFCFAAYAIWTPDPAWLPRVIASAALTILAAETLLEMCGVITTAKLKE